MGLTITRFCVQFDNPDKTYYAGEVVRGKVELVHEEEIRITGAIEVKVKGRAKAKCDFSEEGKRKTEVFLNKKLIICEEGRQLPVGVHFYRFAVTLPTTAPSSFICISGNISYYVRAKIKHMALWNEKTEKSEFTVINRLDLNLNPHLKNPYRDEKHKIFGFFFASGPLIISARLPKTGFAAYEPIPIILDINNGSNVTVNSIHVNLIRIIRWEAIRGHQNIKLQRLRLRGVQKGQSHTWSGNFRIPFATFHFPLVDGCSIVNLGHELIIKAVTSRMHSNLVMHIPVTIADIALREESRTSRVTSQNRSALRAESRASVVTSQNQLALMEESRASVLTSQNQLALREESRASVLTSQNQLALREEPRASVLTSQNLSVQIEDIFLPD